jgi:hypothetical protein
MVFMNSTALMIQRGFNLYDWITKRLDDLPISRDRRSLLSVGCYDQVIEHQIAVCTLLRSRINGSAFALVRLVFEGFVRGAWLKNCATDFEVDKYYEDRLDLKFYQILNAVEKVPGFESMMLSQFKSTAWGSLNSYTHTGVMQSARRFSKEFVEPSYTDEEIIEVLRIVESFALLALQQIASEAGRLDLSNEAGEKLKDLVSNKLPT